MRLLVNSTIMTSQPDVTGVACVASCRPIFSASTVYPLFMYYTKRMKWKKQKQKQILIFKAIVCWNNANYQHTTDVQELIEIVVQEPLCLQKISQRGFKILTSPYRNGVFTNLISPIENSEEESESSQQIIPRESWQFQPPPLRKSQKLFQWIFISSIADRRICYVD